MHQYTSITQIKDTKFSSCEGCESHCCDGSRFHFTPLILDDFVDVYKNFPIVFGYIGDELRALMKLSSSPQGCQYFLENKCSIYEERPPACRLYPITPFYEDILVDTSCHGVGEVGEILTKGSSISNNFYHKRLENFEHKRLKTVHFLKELEDHLKPIGSYQGVEMFKANIQDNEKEYLKYHHLSLEHL